MEIVTIAYTRQGGVTSRLILDEFQNIGYPSSGYLFHSSEYPGLLSFSKAEEIIRACFEQQKALIFVCAAGIAVRQISGFLKSKTEDIPVLVTDEEGRYVISLLSGHLGGGNELAKLCADITGGIPIITTATDLHGKFAVDLFAKKNGLFITDMKKAKMISAHVLNGGTVKIFFEECTAETKIPFSEVILSNQPYHMLKDDETGVLVSPYQKNPSKHILHLIPRQVTLGIGCRKGISAEQIERTVTSALNEYHLNRHAVCRVCSIDLKKEETGLIEFCRLWNLDFETFSPEELMETEGEFHASKFVSNITGVDNVCERSAVKGSGGHLILPKYAKEQVTVAAALTKIQIEF